jgi:hypothetical protein
MAEPRTPLPPVTTATLPFRSTRNAKRSGAVLIAERFITTEREGERSVSAASSSRS